MKSSTTWCHGGCTKESLGPSCGSYCCSFPARQGAGVALAGANSSSERPVLKVICQSRVRHLP